MAGVHLAGRKAASLLLGVCALMAMWLISNLNYLLFHTLAELFSIAVACAIFMLAWNARRFLQNDYLLFVGIAYLFVATVDLVHTLAYEGMDIFTKGGSNLATQLWISARYLESISLLIAPLFLRRKLKKPAAAVASFAVIVALLLASVFRPDVFVLRWARFPECYVDGAGLTAVKIVSEYVICGILLAALAALLAQRKRLERTVLHLVAASICATVLSELAFTLYVGVFDFFNMIGHMLKILSFFLIYRALIEIGLTRPYELLFRDLKRSETELRQSQEKLAQAQAVAHLGSWQFDVAENRAVWSEELYRIFGIDPRQVDLTLETFLSYIHPDDREAVARSMERTLQHKEPYEMDYHIVRPDGTQRVVHARGEARCDDARNVRSAFGTVLDVTELKRAEQALREARDELEVRVDERTVELAQTVDVLQQEVRERMQAESKLKTLNEALRRRAIQLRALASELTRAEQNERRRLAQVLHDHVQQLLVAASMHVQVLRKQVRDRKPHRSLEQVRKLLAESLQVSHSLTAQLSPPILYEAGLAPALQWLRRQMQERYGLTITVEVDGEIRGGTDDTGALLFQAVRELLFNVVKHAKVRAADVRLSRLDGERVEIVVTDKGVGFDPTQNVTYNGEGDGFGLFSIRERLELLGGTLNVNSAPGKGARVSLVAPLHQPTTSDEAF